MCTQSHEPHLELNLGEGRPELVEEWQSEDKKLRTDNPGGHRREIKQIFVRAGDRQVRNTRRAPWLASPRGAIEDLGIWLAVNVYAESAVLPLLRWPRILTCITFASIAFSCMSPGIEGIEDLRRQFESDFISVGLQVHQLVELGQLLVEMPRLKPVVRDWLSPSSPWLPALLMLPRADAIGRRQRKLNKVYLGALGGKSKYREFWSTGGRLVHDEAMEFDVDAPEIETETETDGVTLEQTNPKTTVGRVPVPVVPDEMKVPPQLMIAPTPPLAGKE